MKGLLLPLAALGLVTLLGACGASRDEPNGTFLDPVCMPDGSPVLRQLQNPDGTYGDPRGKKENCPWYKKQ